MQFAQQSIFQKRKHHETPVQTKTLKTFGFPYMYIAILLIAFCALHMSQDPISALQASSPSQCSMASVVALKLLPVAVAVCECAGGSQAGGRV